MPVIDYGSDQFNRRRRAEPSRYRSTEFNYDYHNGLDLKPGSKLHNNIVDKIMERAYASKRIMSGRYDAWRKIDWTLSAYVQVDDKEEDIISADYRKPVSIVFPYSYAILETLLGYLVAAFFQDPIFRYEGVSPEDTIGAIMMEKIVDIHCNKSKVALNLHTMFRDSLAYGFGVSAPGWNVVTGQKTRIKNTGYRGMFGMLLGQGQEKVVEDATLFEGNELLNIDPYLCLPDPNVPIHDIQKGEFFGWIDKTNIMNLLSDEKNDEDMFNVRYLKELGHKRSFLSVTDQSERERKVGGTRILRDDGVTNATDNINMFIKIIPKDWKLGENEYPEKWAFSVSADEILIKAKPLELDHNMFPVTVSAPDFDGYSTTPVSRMEILYGMQGILDWLFNSHIMNVRKSINDMLIVDPYMVNVKDVEDSKPGKIIRLRRPAWGKGVKDAVQQLNVTDITKGNIQDSALIVQWMQKIGASDDATMGSLRQGGPERLTGKEFEGTQQGSITRLERIARIIGLQSLQDIGYMFAAHTQQLMTEELYVTTTGRWQETLMREYGSKIKSDRMKVTPFDILIDYDLKVRDGSVPGSNSSKVWVKMFEVIAKNPRLAQSLDIVRIFKHIARNTGAKNVEEFEIRPDQQVGKDVQAGNLIPFDQAIGGKA